jgi:hypothetical protein
MRNITFFKISFSLIFVTFNFFAHGQDIKSFKPEGEAKYFDFWVGTWYQLKEDNSLDSTTYFKVVTSVNPSSFLEEWHFAGMSSIAVRAWDKTNNKWGFVWVSDNGLYQVWDTKKVNGNWYIYKQFTVDGDTYISRQGFLRQVDGTVLRISEKSYDGEKWELRFQQHLKRVSE